MAPREVPGDTTMPTTIYFSGLSKLSNGISITATKPMTVVK